MKHITPSPLEHLPRKPQTSSPVSNPNPNPTVSITRCRTGGCETICPPADGSSIQKSRRIYVRLRTGPQSAHLWWSAVAKLQAISVPTA